jgi:hypothetical protein
LQKTVPQRQLEFKLQAVVLSRLNAYDTVLSKNPTGNEDADQYVEWLRPLAEGMRRVLKKQGSLVIDIGGAWKPGLPTRSLYHFELLITLCRDYGFHL